MQLQVFVKQCGFVKRAFKACQLTYRLKLIVVTRRSGGIMEGVPSLVSLTCAHKIKAQFSFSFSHHHKTMLINNSMENDYFKLICVGPPTRGTCPNPGFFFLPENQLI